jgi:hypothetical protein
LRTLRANIIIKLHLIKTKQVTISYAALRKREFPLHLALMAALRAALREVRMARAPSPLSVTCPQSLKSRWVRAVRPASARNPSSDTSLQYVKLRLVRATNHNFKNSYYHNKSTHHKLGETNNKLNTQ